MAAPIGQQVRVDCPTGLSRKAIHVRLPASVLQALLAAKGQDGLVSVTETPSQAISLRIGDQRHPLHSIKEVTPHDVFQTLADGSWQKQGRISERLLLEADVTQHLRERTEAAVAAKGDRQVVVLQNGGNLGKGRSGLAATSSAPASAVSSPRITSANATPKPRQTPRLVANHIAKPKPFSQMPDDTGLPVAPAPAPASPADSQEVLVPRKDGDDSLDSASSSTGTCGPFNFSSGASASSRTSVSSGDSPPFKDGMQVEPPPSDPHHNAPKVAIITATPVAAPQYTALGFASNDLEVEEIDMGETKPARPNSLPPKPPPQASTSKTTAAPLPAKPAAVSASSYYNPMAPPPPTFVSRHDTVPGGGSSEDQRSKSPRPDTKPQASGRTAGGARLSRPQKTTLLSAWPEPASNAPSPIPSALPKERIMKSTPVSSPLPDSPRLNAKRKSDTDAEEERHQKKKKVASNTSASVRRKEAYFTSSDSESEVPLAKKASPKRGTSTIKKGKATVTKALKGSPLPSYAPTPQLLQSTPSAASPLSISSEQEYEEQHARFAELSAEFSKLCIQIKGQRRVLSSFIAGKDVSDEQRRSIPSQKEAKQLAERAASMRAQLADIKSGLWSWANSRSLGTA